LSSRIPEAWRIVYIIVRYASNKNSSSFGNLIHEHKQILHQHFPEDNCIVLGDMYEHHMYDENDEGDISGVVGI
jgi:hypothetical protein